MSEFLLQQSDFRAEIHLLYLFLHDCFVFQDHEQQHHGTEAATHHIEERQREDREGAPSKSHRRRGP